MAGPPVEMKVRGVKQLEAGARRLFESLEHAQAHDAIAPTTEQVAATVRARTPVRTGRLRASVRTELVGNVGHVSMGGPAAPYAIYVRPKLVLQTAKRTERAFRKHAENVCSREIGRMSWGVPV